MGKAKILIRHPDEFPIELNVLGSLKDPVSKANLQLICHSERPYQSGAVIAIKIPSISHNLEVSGTIQSCQSIANGYEVGIGFNSEDAIMRMRMLEQLCYIQRYRKYVLNTEGRELSDQDAAMEWIGKYAHLFPT